MRRLGRLLNLPPRRIAVGYLCFGVAWIVVTDGLVRTYAASPAEMARLQTVKGWVFVALSGLLILGLTMVREFQLSEVRRLSENAFQELQVLHRIFRHDFRNDLNLVLGYLDLVRQEAETSSVAEHAETAYAAAERLASKGEKLQSVSHESIEPPDGAAVDLAALIGDVVEDFRAANPEVAVEADLPDHATVIGTPTIARAVQELLENAVTHHPGPPSAIELGVSVTRDPETVRVQVRDNGPAIPASEVAPILSGEESPLEHTSGVGLWLVAWVTRAFDGTVDFDPGPGGNVVTLTFNRDRGLGGVLSGPVENVAVGDPTG